MILGLGIVWGLVSLTEQFGTLKKTPVNQTVQGEICDFYLISTRFAYVLSHNPQDTLTELETCYFCFDDKLITYMVCPWTRSY